MIERNVRVGGGEVDLLAVDRGRRLVVEVRTTSDSEFPLDALTDEKRARVRRLAGLLGIGRVDGLGVGVFDGHVIIHWDPDSF